VSLAVARRQRGTAIRARIAVRSPLRRLTLSALRDGAPLASLRLASVRAGRRTVALRLGPAGQRALARAGKLGLTVRLVAIPATGSRLIVRRPVTLVRPAAR
jgi:hypothetical protein